MKETFTLPKAGERKNRLQLMSRFGLAAATVSRKVSLALRGTFPLGGSSSLECLTPTAGGDNELGSGGNP